MIAGFFGAKGQIIGIDADAVAADEARLKRHEIPFCPRGGEHVAGIDIERLEDQRQFVHECDVEIALGVLDHLGGFGDLDRRRAMNAGRDHRSVDVGNDIERLRILRRDTFVIVSNRCCLSPGLMRSGEYPTVKSTPAFRPEISSRIGNAFFLDRAGIDGQFIDDDVALLEHARRPSAMPRSSRRDPAAAPRRSGSAR